MVRQASTVAARNAGRATADERASHADSASQALDRLRAAGVCPVLRFSDGSLTGTVAATRRVDVDCAPQGSGPARPRHRQVALRIDGALPGSHHRRAVERLRDLLPAQDAHTFLVEDLNEGTAGLIPLLEAAFPRSSGYLFETLSDAGSARPDVDRQAALLQRYFDGRGRWLPALHAGVRSHCPLLAAERTTTLTAATAIATPAETAWIELVVDLVTFADAAGRLCHRALGDALECCVDSGDGLFEYLRWPTLRQAEDARMNRRMAVRIEGIGDLVARRGNDPSSIETLRATDRLIADIRTTLWRRSRSLANERGTLPALTERQPSSAWRDSEHAEDWARRWNAAVKMVCVRHRNLLVLSPYALLPRSGSVHGDFADLMPVLGYADAVSFAAPRLMLNWNVADYRYFYARLRSQVERLNATSFIAVGA